jgi:hypothetical protein
MLSELVEQPMTVACVESTEDHMVAFCTELAEDFSLTTVSVKLTPTGASVDGVEMTLYDALAGVDFIVTTAFHAADVYDAAEMLKKPVVIVSVNDTLLHTFESELGSGAITIIADDPAFVERFRMYLAERFRNRGDLRIHSMQDVSDDPSIAVHSTVLYTRAARKRMNEEEYHLLPPPMAFLSDRAAGKVLQCMLSTHAKRALQPA